jgi:hypothetical protein
MGLIYQVLGRTPCLRADSPRRTRNGDFDSLDGIFATP